MSINQQHAARSLVATAGDAFETIHLDHPTATFHCHSPGAFHPPTALSLPLYVASLDHPVRPLIRDPTSGELVVRVPLGVASDTKTVEIGTFAVVLAASLYLLSVFVKTARRLQVKYHDKVE